MTAKKIPVFVLAVLAVTAAVGYPLLSRRAGHAGSAVRVSGNIEVIDAEVSFKLPGRVIERLVDEGEPVKQGQVVARLDSDDLASDLAVRRAEYQAAAQALAELKAGSRPQEIASSHALLEKAKAALDELLAGSRPQEIAVAQATVASAQAEEVRAKTELVRRSELLQSRAIPAEDYDRSQATYDVAAAKLREVREHLALVREGPRKEQIEQGRAALAQAQAQYDLVKAGPRQETIDQAKARLDQAAAAVKLAETKLGYTTVFSPLTGVVLSKNVEPGEYVAPGTPVVTVGDLVNVWLRAYIAETDLEQVKPGQEVRVTTDATPGKVYQGRVSFIASEAEFTPKNVQTPKERTKLVYRIKIDIKNPNMELKRGMPADGEILVGAEAAGQP